MPKYPISNPKDTNYYIRKILDFLGMLVSAMAVVAVILMIFVLA